MCVCVRSCCYLCMPAAAPVGVPRTPNADKLVRAHERSSESKRKQDNCFVYTYLCSPALPTYCIGVWRSGLAPAMMRMQCTNMFRATSNHTFVWTQIKRARAHANYLCCGDLTIISPTIISKNIDSCFLPVVMLVSKIKPCMSQYKHLYSETANGSLKLLWLISLKPYTFKNNNWRRVWPYTYINYYYYY